MRCFRVVYKVLFFTLLSHGVMVAGVSASVSASLSDSSLLTLESALARVTESNPVLKAMALEQRAAQWQVQQAGMAQPYQLSMNAENIAGTGVAQGGGAMESTLSVSHVFERGGKSALRSQLAQQQVDVLAAEQAAKHMDVLAEAARRFIHVLTDQQRFIIVHDALLLAQRLHDVVDKRVKAGRSPQLERRRAVIALTRSELAFEHAEHEQQVSRMKLAVMWGDAKPQFDKVDGSLFDLGEIKAFEDYAQDMNKNPDLIAASIKLSMVGAQLKLAHAQARTNIELSAGIRHLAKTDDGAAVLFASIPLGSGRRAKPQVNAATLSLESQSYLYEQQRLALQVLLFDAYQELKHARTAVQQLRKTIIPQAQYALNDYEKGYRAGRYSFPELVVAQQILLDAKIEAVMMARNYHRFRIEIDRLIGVEGKAGFEPLNGGQP